MALGQFMPERPVARDDSDIEHQPPLELSREPHVSVRDARADRDARDGDDHKSHDPYQPL
ncbi:hypothetical protein GA0074692_0960 [Micromonospora pallida]|uniref:Uncharacterized protein n=1 Tax=Micromonospora pallida TaxID=145854 RepID=A0A1C6RUI5_9ACTN|nr:hypothetical protein GA0074692_0960 [Micromonospora pallida]